VLCRSNLVRTEWDGDQILHEISAPASGSTARAGRAIRA
jgi:hypothetical protein